ncbi:MAG: glutamate--tRNA ligase [Chitinophagales bacterium]|nr:glutamate--tRNA ligase [Chitinophagales bacterium]
MSDQPVRVRFAPSPTGPLHIGGVRTALYNFLFAKKNNGSFIIRIEDTDQSRFVQGAEQYILEALQWCGIQHNEGPDIGGRYGPYRQSERKNIYLKYAEQLLNSGNAYYAFDTPEELEDMRQRLKTTGSQTIQYDSTTREAMKNSLTMSSEETKTRVESGDHYVIRIKIPPNEEVHFSDLIRSEVIVSTNQMDDKVLYKSDGMPTYHLANVVDDYLMKITHVIRGEEWLPSAPLHWLLYQFLGWKKEMPEFAHLPLLLRPDGNGKLSKRDGDRLGFPVFPLNWKDPQTGEESTGFRERGFFSDAFVNMIALLGWNPPSHKEVMTLEEMIGEFSIERVHKAGAKFDFEKAKYFNHEYMKKKDSKDLASAFEKILEEKHITATADYSEKVCGVLKNRCTFISEFWENGYFFFEAPESFDESVISKKWNNSSGIKFEILLDALSSHNDFSLAGTEKFLTALLEENDLKAGDILPLLRIMLIGIKNGPAVFELISLLGKEETIVRIQKAIEIFNKSIYRTEKG